MTNPIPVSPSILAGKTWMFSKDFLFASKKILCALDLTEVSKAAVCMPLGFIKSGNSYQLVAINGVVKGQNLFVDKSGRWLADYIPLEYRLYPFLLAQDEKGNSVLCIDGDSGLISESSDNLPFFNGNDLSDLLKTAMSSFSNMLSRRAQTSKIAQLLADHNLIKPWNLEVNPDKNSIKVDGLFCIDEAALAKLNGDQLIELRDTGALAVLYCQLLSMHQSQLINKLLQRMNANNKFNTEQAGDFKIGGFQDDSGTLSFENL